MKMKAGVTQEPCRSGADTGVSEDSSQVDRCLTPAKPGGVKANGVTREAGAAGAGTKTGDSRRERRTA